MNAHAAKATPTMQAKSMTPSQSAGVMDALLTFDGCLLDYTLPREPRDEQVAREVEAGEEDGEEYEVAEDPLLAAGAAGAAL
jgi:hypothetical protein